jgi:hypothetical protein
LFLSVELVPVALHLQVADDKRETDSYLGIQQGV